MEPDGCMNCSLLRNEMEKRVLQTDQNNLQQLNGFLTLKQKIFVTDNLITEYQSSKLECDNLTRKNEEFARIVGQLHRDLNKRHQDYTQLYSEVDPVKKANAELQVKVRELHDEAQKWKFEAEAGKNFTAQLVEKVKVLEKFEDEVKEFTTRSKDHEKMESKMEVLKGQLKDSKEAANKLRKDLSKVQKSNKQLIKYAKIWGRVVETHGKFNVLQKRFYTKLCSDDGKDNEEDDDDADLDATDEQETDEQSKLLEQLLSDGGGGDSDMPPPDILSSDTEVSKGNVKSPWKAERLPTKFSPSPKKVEQTSPRVRRRNGLDNVTPSKSKSPDKTPTRIPVTRRRSRTASTVSQPNSESGFTTESEKENEKGPGTRTRSRATKASVKDIKSPEPNTMRVNEESTLPNGPEMSMNDLLEAEPSVGTCLSSSESDAECEGPSKSLPLKTAVAANPVHPPSPKSIAGIRPLMNLFESDVPEQEKEKTTEKKHYSIGPLEPVASANSSSLFGFGASDSESEDASNRRPESSRDLATNPSSNPAILAETSSSVTTFAGIFEKTIRREEKSPTKPSVDSSSKLPVSENDDTTIDERPSCLFNLEEDLNISSEELTSDSLVTQFNQEAVSEIVTEVLISREDEPSSNIIVEPEETKDLNAQNDAVLDESKSEENQETKSEQIAQKSPTKPLLEENEETEQVVGKSVEESPEEKVQQKSPSQYLNGATSMKSPGMAERSEGEKEVTEPESLEEKVTKDVDGVEKIKSSVEVNQEMELKGEVTEKLMQEENVDPSASPKNPGLEEGLLQKDWPAVNKTTENEVSQETLDLPPPKLAEIQAVVCCNPKSPVMMESTVENQESIQDVTSEKTGDEICSDKLLCETQSQGVEESKEESSHEISTPKRDSQHINDRTEKQEIHCDSLLQLVEENRKDELEAVEPVSSVGIATFEREVSIDPCDASKQLKQPISSDEKTQVSPLHSATKPEMVKSQLEPSSCRFATPRPISSKPFSSNIQEKPRFTPPPPIVPEPLPIQRCIQSEVRLSHSQPSAFKVPRTPAAAKESMPSVHANFPWSNGVGHGVKRTAADDEVAVILKQIRTTIIPLPATVSPLPKTPPPKPPLVQVKEEPKCRFPILPRCAFNWTAKKLPISDQLTEQFGAYLHPGVQVRVRFRRVGKRRLRDLRSTDVVSHNFQGVANFAEAERRPKPFVKPLSPAQDADDVEKRLSSPKCSVLAEESNNSLEKKPSLTVSPSLPLSPVVDIPKTVTKVAKKTAPANRSRVDGLFGSDSSDTSESEPELEAPSAKDRSKDSKKAHQILNECRPSTPLANNHRAKLLPQTFPLGKSSRPNSPSVKSIELRRELTESPSLTRLGRVSKPSGLIAPCSEALSSLCKTKTATRVVAPLRRPAKDPQVPTTPVATTPATPVFSDPSQDDSSFRKQVRVSHATKRALESDAVIPNFASPSKRGKCFLETTAGSSPSLPTPQSLVPTKIHSKEVPVKTKKVLPVHPQEFVKLGTKVAAPPSVKEQLEQATLPEIGERNKEKIAENVGANETEQEMQSETSETSSSEEEERPNSSPNKHGDEKNPPQLPDNPQSPDIEESPQSPDIEESPQSPDMDESPRSPDDQFAHSTEEKVVELVPSIPVGNESEQVSAFELISQQLLLKDAPIAAGSKKLKKDIHSFVNRVFKAPVLTDALLTTAYERMIRPDSRKIPSILIRQLISTVVHSWEAEMDLSMTPPAPPLSVVHQRCVLLLKILDEKNKELELDPDANQHKFSDYFLSEMSAIMFQQDSQLTLEEMCSLARAYTAVCRSRASLSRARTFLYDCLYFLPPRSYALTFTILSVWAEVLRQTSFPLGLSCIDQTIVYLLFHCCKVKAVPGITGKVLQVRSFLQSAHGYKDTATSTLENLVNYLKTRFEETNSVDEASSLSWSLALLARWEGVDFAISLIEKQLWPFLQRWSSGDGTNIGAAAAIVAIGLLGKSVPPKKRGGVKNVLSAMKVICQSEEVNPSVKAAAVEAVVLLGESEDPKSVIELLKTWKIVHADLSPHLQQVLKAFLKRHPDGLVV